MAHDSISTYNDDATCAMALADFQALDLDPTEQPAPDTTLIKIDAADLRALLPLASEDATRFNLCGVHVDIDGVAKAFTLVATDGHCLGSITRSAADVDGVEHFDGVSLTLSREAVTNACKVAGRGKRAHPVFVEVNRKRGACIIVGQARITACEVDGAFPAYKQVIPKGALPEKPAVVALNLAIVARFVAMGELSGVSGSAGARITMTDALSPVRLDFLPGVIGVVMPMRL